MTNEERKFFDEHGICMRCRKAKRAIGFTQCPECLEKELFRAQKRRDAMTPEMREAENAKRRELYYRRKATGICVRCGKPATHGMFCYKHYIQMRVHSQENSRKRSKCVNAHQYRIEKHLCYCCGAPIEKGNLTKVCNACREKLVSNLPKDGGWKRYGSFKFGRALYEPTYQSGQAGARAGGV